MRIAFQKHPGVHDLGIAFFWRLALSGGAGPVADSFIPELFYDFLHVTEGEVRDAASEARPIPRQTLKTIHTRRRLLNLTPRLVLYGARLTLRFAESYDGPPLTANALLPVDWLARPVDGLPEFAEQVTRVVARIRRKTAVTLLAPDGSLLPAAAAYSARHRRRLFKRVFGVSRRQMAAVESLHAFVGRTCDFSLENPRIIAHLDADVFYDQPHLNNTFKKMTGLSPLEYFESGAIIQDNLMAASYNVAGAERARIAV